MSFCRDRRSSRPALMVKTVCAIAALLMTSAAEAATISNRSADEIKLTIAEGSTRQDKVLSAGKVIDGVCQKGCIIRLNDNANDEYELEGSERLSVEGGFLYYDTLQSEIAPPSGSASGSERRQIN